MKQKTGLLIGRFQPFHKGHLYLIKEGLKAVDKIIIGIGTANITDDNNPFDYETRKNIIKSVFYKEKLNDRLIKIVPLDDFYNDKKWLVNVLKQTGKFNLVIGNNKWTNDILKNAGYKILNCKYYQRNLYEGWRIRKLINTNKKWQQRTPEYLVKWFEKQIKNHKFITKRYDHVVLGGTFDRLHLGHIKLLNTAIESANKITIGLTTEAIQKNKLLSEIIEKYEVRKKNLKNYFANYLWCDRTRDNFKIEELNDIYGSTLKNNNIDAIVVSGETLKNALKINEERKKIGFKTLQIIVVSDVLSKDGKKITSERIRLGEIDKKGEIFQPQALNSKKNELRMPENLRKSLQKPFGRVYKNTKSLLDSLNRSKKTLIIAVGDIVVDSLLKSGINPDVKIIDFRSRRKEILIDFKLKKIKKYINNSGTINLKTAKIIKDKILLAINKHKKSWITITGEEDLLALPSILFAPINSLIIYGHFQLGAVCVLVTEEIKIKALNFINKFN